MSKYKLSLDTVLSHVNRKDRNFFSKLSTEEKKAFAGVVMMRFISSAPSPYADYNLVAVNEIANQHFYEMWEHPELQYLMLTASVSGDPMRHSWIPNAKKSAGNAILADFISHFWPGTNRLEREIVLSNFDQKSFDEFVDGSGVEQEEAKKLKKSFKAR